MLTKHLLKQGFTFEELTKAGLSKEGRRGPIDRFHRRLLWPIKDLGGDVVGFGARRLFDDDQIEATPRTSIESLPEFQPLEEWLTSFSDVLDGPAGQ